MASDLLAAGLAALTFSRKVTTGLLEDIPDDKLMHQPMPGAKHALWVMGHVALTDEFFLREAGKRQVEKFDAWKELFFMGSTVKSISAEYPSGSEVRDYLGASRQNLLDWFKSISAAELHDPLPEDLKSFGPTPAVLMTTIACHECVHAGQLTMVRHSLGIGSKFG